MNTVHIDDAACQQVYLNMTINSTNCWGFKGFRDINKAECEKYITPTKENCSI